MEYIKKIIKINKVNSVAYLLIGFTNSFLLNYKIRIFQELIDDFINGEILLAAILFYGFILIVHSVLCYVDEYPGNKLKHSIYLQYKLFALEKISNISGKEYQETGTGKLVQRIENGALAGRDMLYHFWFRLIRELIPTAGFSLIYIWQIYPKITVIIVAGYLFVFLVTKLLIKFLQQIKEKIMGHEELLNHYLIRGFMEMTVFRVERQFAGEIAKAGYAKDKIVKAKVKMSLIHEAFFTIFALLVGILNIMILVYGWYTRDISVGALVALISLLNNAYNPIAIFNVLYVQYKLDKAAYDRFVAFLDLPADDQLMSGEKMDSFNGRIEIKNLSFSYGERNILENINLCISRGEKVVLVGESGSGKSTLIKIISGFLKYDRGSVLIDDLELKDCCLDDLYRYMGYADQNGSIFDGTLRENLVFDDGTDDAEIMEVLRKMQLGTLVAALPDGLDTMIGERGAKLSGGEKQRIVLARILLRRKNLIILDEATSALDNITEEKVLEEMLKTAGRECTVIAIAHKMKAVTQFDRIIVFKEGSVIAQGKLKELMSGCPYFVKLYNS